MCALAVAMGIGRFAFTPLLPMMLHDGVVNLGGASWLATANYVGYLVGALLCTFQPLIWRRFPSLPPVNGPWMVKLGLLLTILLTAGMAIPYSAVWPELRFASGVASALVFVYTSGFCLQQMARLGAPGMGGLIYVGPGAGIVVTGLFASVLVAWGAAAVAGWLIFAALAVVLTLLIAPVFRLPAAAVPAGAAAPAAAFNAPPIGRLEMPMLSLAYGLAGFGYIITATFLPVIARQAIPGSPWLDLFWPIFGSGVMIGAVIASRVPAGPDNRLLLLGCYVVQAAGIVIGIVSPSAFGFAIGSLLLGLPFTAITFFAMQEIRRLKAPASAPSYMGLVTALYGLGQIAGPPLVALLLSHSATPGQGFERGLEIAAASLVVGAVMFGLMARLYPPRSTH
ncbi:MAG: YbfB/YjiJ family MFS transporter [Comamonadaceae bacterium]|nr:MAG: YbfB/YjiJ family MFS transporter [Comamonadaceae bacterium]